MLVAALGLAAIGGCASSDATDSFDPADSGAVKDSATDVKTDSKPDAAAQLCDLAKCPAPPGGAQKCCAGMNVCGYQGGAICYPLPDGGTGGSGGGSP
jgi:hypothetical protein